MLNHFSRYNFGNRENSTGGQHGPQSRSRQMFQIKMFQKIVGKMEVDTTGNQETG